MMPRPVLLSYEQDGSLCRVCLNRPSRGNALTAPVIRELLNRLDEASNNKSVRVVVLTGKGRWGRSTLGL